MLLPNLDKAHIINKRSLSAEIQMFGGKAIFSFMLHPDGRWVYRHLMVQIKDGHYETVPVF